MAITPDFIAGAFGGCAGVIAGHPLDTIKVQIQTQDSGGKYNSLLDCIKTIKSQNLSTGFFRGMSGPLISYGYLSAIFFGCYGWTLKKLNYVEDARLPPTYSIIATASMVAAVPQVICGCPIDLTKVILQSQIPHKQGMLPSGKFYKGPIETAMSILKTNGLKGLYRGFSTHLARDLPSAALYMTLYKGVQYEGHKRFPNLPQQVINFFGGGCTGVCSWMLILPLDVIKSRLQADPQRIMYKGFWECAKNLYINDGPRAFFSGLIPMTIRAFLVNGVILMVYSESLRVFKKFEKNLM